MTIENALYGKYSVFLFIYQSINGMKKILVMAVLALCFKPGKSQVFVQGLLIYDPPENYKTSSLLFTGANITLTAFNVINFNSENRDHSNGGFAIVTGLAQIFYTRYNSDKMLNKSYNILNYSIGTATTVIGGLRLFKKRNKPSLVTIIPFSDLTRGNVVMVVRLGINR